MKKIFLVGLLLVMLIGLCGPASTIQVANAQQAVDPQQKAKALLLKMTPEEKVGQLFIVTFKGSDATTKDSKILDLINSRFLGGVVLRAANDNFIGPTNTVTEVYRLTYALQVGKWNGAQKQVTNPVTNTPYLPNYVPLFIGVSQEGDLSPYDQIINGLTPLPSSMAIGATWDTKLAEKVGSTLGAELQTVGINLFLGPSLDVLDVVRKEGGEDLGTRTYGGDPYWVGEMGRAFIRGLHQGSEKRLAVVAKHFPGRGGSDRPPEEEVATVKKSLEQLKQIELAPFFAVTGNAPSPEATTDGLLVSHIRYQGFQGNIRATTRPLSFDQTALEQILNLQPFAPWRQAGGVLVSDNLGSMGIRKFYDPSSQGFDARQVARNAFLAGNDLLYADNFIATGDADALVTLQRTLEFFAQKYREDQAFAQRVDASVTRLLTLKFKLYPEFNLNTVTPPENKLSEVGKSQQMVFDVARKAVSLISPSAIELSQVLPRPPEIRERILFITDATSGRQCSLCSDQQLLAVDGLQSAIVRLYGPKAGGQVQVTNLSSYSFNDLMLELNNNKDKPAKLAEDLRLADWVVFASLNVTPAEPESNALHRLLTERADLVRNKRVILFAFNAPYYLDATDISKLTAFYGLYSKTPAFVEVAARILFQELTPAGASPVSVPGAGYDLGVIVSPDPAQVIPLELDVPGTATPTPQLTITPRTTISPSPTPVRFKVGDTLPLRTGIIYDHNKNPVPDGTVVRFLFTLGAAESSTQSQVDAVTSGGIARGSFRIPNAGLLEIRVSAEPAVTSKLLRLEISSSGAVAITQITPTPQPSATATITLTPTSTLPPTATPVPTPAPPVHPGMGDWFLSVVMISGVSVGFFYFGQRKVSMRWGFRWGLMTLTGGLIAYLYLAIRMPGSQAWLDGLGQGGILLFTLIGSLIGFLGGLSWRRWLGKRANGNRPRRTNESP